MRLMKTQYRATRIRLYPNKDQSVRLAQMFGSARWFYNHTLALRMRHYRMFGKKEGFKSLNYIRLSRHCTKTLFKRKPWLRSIYRISLTQKLIDQELAMQARYTKKGKPRFKSRKHKQSFAIPGIEICRGKIDNHKIKLRKDLHIRIGGEERIPEDGIITTITIKKWTFDRYEAIVRTKLEAHAVKHPKGDGIGIDLNIGDNLFVTNTGRKHNTAKPLKLHAGKLARWQKIQSRRIKGSNRRDKARQMVAKTHFKIQEQRKYGLHIAARELLKRENQAGSSHPSFVVVEDLNVANMSRKGGNRKRGLNRSFNDRSISEFKRILEYKCEDLGIDLVKVNPKYTSKTCSVCNTVNKNLTLADREWECAECGTIHNRDHNAAKNILRAGTALRAERLNGAGVRHDL